MKKIFLALTIAYLVPVQAISNKTAKRLAGITAAATYLGARFNKYNVATTSQSSGQRYDVSQKLTHLRQAAIATTAGAVSYGLLSRWTPESTITKAEHTINHALHTIPLLEEYNLVQFEKADLSQVVADETTSTALLTQNDLVEASLKSISPSRLIHIYSQAEQNIQSVYTQLTRLLLKTKESDPLYARALQAQTAAKRTLHFITILIDKVVQHPSYTQPGIVQRIKNGFTQLRSENLSIGQSTLRALSTLPTILVAARGNENSTYKDDIVLTMLASGIFYAIARRWNPETLIAWSEKYLQPSPEAEELLTLVEQPQAFDAQVHKNYASATIHADAYAHIEKYAQNLKKASSYMAYIEKTGLNAKLTAQVVHIKAAIATQSALVKKACELLKKEDTLLAQQQLKVARTPILKRLI